MRSVITRHQWHMSPSSLSLIIIILLTPHIATAFDSNLRPGDTFSGNIVSLVEEITGERPYTTFEVDFDNDSKNELVIGILCGNAGCENLVFRVLGGMQYEYITRVFFHSKGFQFIRKKPSEFSDLQTYIRSNAVSGCLLLLEYENNNYREVSKKCGSSDLFHEITSEKIIEVEL